MNMSRFFLTASIITTVLWNAIHTPEIKAAPQPDNKTPRQMDSIIANNNIEQVATNQSTSKKSNGTKARVNLSDEQQDNLAVNHQNHVLSNPWWQNVDIYGFGGVGYYETGGDGTQPYGTFSIKEASLFIEGEVWENTSFFLEVQTNRLGQDDKKYVRTGEVYLHLRNLVVGEKSMGLKMGRIDIPFGEEYLWQDAIDNPLITNSVAYPYGFDEGVLAYGNIGELGWITAITDGTDHRSQEDSTDKAYNLKFYGDVSANLYLSFSWMSNGSGAKSAFEFGGSHFEPVTCNAQEIASFYCTTADSSPSSLVESQLFQIDGKYTFKEWGYISFFGGKANQDDRAPGFDRDIRWFTVEPYWKINQNWFAIARYSEIGTYDSELGYHFDGKIFANGNSSFGFDTQRLRRTSLGLGWILNPNMRIKLEIGSDDFTLIDSSIRPNEGDRDFFGLEAVVKF